MSKNSVHLDKSDKSSSRFLFGDIGALFAPTAMYML